jgi:hypothetical protein
MSYCTVRRQAVQQRVRHLEERLKEQEECERDSPASARLREELARAMAALVTLGECGD